jgi:hypothetical protein
VLADRVDAVEHHLESFLRLRPDNPITETGVLSEFTHHGLSSRLGQHRADLTHQPLDPIIVAGPWVAAATVASSGVRKLVGAVRHWGRPPSAGLPTGRPGDAPRRAAIGGGVAGQTWTTRSARRRAASTRSAFPWSTSSTHCRA